MLKVKRLYITIYSTILTLICILSICKIQQGEQIEPSKNLLKSLYILVNYAII